MNIELKIERMSFGSKAIGRVTLKEGEPPVVVFVSGGAAPGDIVRAELTKKHKNYWEASLSQILTPSKLRQTPPCTVFGRCGGCDWQHLSYQTQIDQKVEILLHQISRTTRITHEELQKKLTIHPAKEVLGYRTRIQVRGTKKGIGFFSQHSHDIVEAETCVVAHVDIQNKWREFLAKDRAKELTKKTNQFKVEWTRFPNGEVHESINRKHAALGFTQVNSTQNEVMVNLVQNHVKKLAESEDPLLDLYGGKGNLSKKLATPKTKVVCVDSYNDGRDPTTLTRQDLHSDHSGEFLLLRTSVESFLNDQRWLDWEIKNFKAVIADPPREGLKGTALQISKLPTNTLILVSCDPTTMARDLEILLDSFSLEKIHFIDLFPQTHHIEALSFLTRRG